MEFKTNISKIQSIFERYQTYLSFIRKDDVFELAYMDKDDRSDAIKYIGRVYRSFMSLNKEEKVLINKLFVENETHKISKSYLKKKIFINAINHFLEAFENV